MAVMCQRSGIDPRALPYGCLAIALYAAPNLPYPHRPEEDLVVYAEHGLQELGGVARAEELHQQWLELNARWLSGHRGDYRNAVRPWLRLVSPALPPDPDRFDRCLRDDFGLRRARRGD